MKCISKCRLQDRIILYHNSLNSLCIHRSGIIWYHTIDTLIFNDKAFHDMTWHDDITWDDMTWYDLTPKISFINTNNWIAVSGTNVNILLFNKKHVAVWIWFVTHKQQSISRFFLLYKKRVYFIQSVEEIFHKMVMQKNINSCDG